MTDKKRGQGKTQSIGGLSPSLPRSLRGGLRVGLLTSAPLLQRRILERIGLLPGSERVMRTY